MRVIAKTGKNDLAMVYITETNDNKMIEFVESIQPPFSREEKWVFIISTLYGCPVKCRFCDAGTYYSGKLSEDDMFFQIKYLIKTRYDFNNIPVKRLKIQFARTGEPSFNMNVIKVIEELPDIHKNIMPSLSTIAPVNREEFFDKLMAKKKMKFRKNFQLQFSIHTTDERQRDLLIPIKKWSFKKISRYGEKFFDNNGRKITLNFALSENSIIDKRVLIDNFSPEYFLIKLTPINPTFQAQKNGLISDFFSSKINSIIENIKDSPFEVIESIGELEENHIGSNCGQYINTLKFGKELNDGYTYEIKKINY